MLLKQQGLKNMAVLYSIVSENVIIFFFYFFVKSYICTSLVLQGESKICQSATAVHAKVAVKLNICLFTHFLVVHVKLGLLLCLYLLYM